MARRSSRPRNSARLKQDRMAYTIFALSGVAIAVLVYFLIQPGPNEDCVRHAGAPERHTVVLIDQTDVLSPEQIGYVKRLIMAEYARLQQQDLFTLVGLNPNDSGSSEPATQTTAPASDRPRIQFSRCRVALSEEAVVWRENPMLIDQAFRESFGTPLSNAFDAMDNMPPAANSPIIEQIDILAATANFSSPSISRRLVIVSDMAQYTDPGESHYPPANEPDARFTLPAHDDFGAAANLSGMEVRIHYIRRDGLERTQTQDHPAYWTAYFRNSGVTDVRVGWGFADDPEDIAPLPPIRVRGGQDLFQGASPESDAPGFSPAALRADENRNLGERASSPPTATTAAVSQNDRALTVRSAFVRLPVTREALAYFIDWPTTVNEQPRFDALRFVLLLEPNQCPIAFASTSAFLASDQLSELAQESRLVRALSINEQQENQAVASLIHRLDLNDARPVRCDAFSVRMAGDVAMRRLRCGNGDYSAIDDVSWARLSRAYNSTSSGSFGIRAGTAQSTSTEIEMILASARGRCVPGASYETLLNQGLHLTI